MNNSHRQLRVYKELAMADAQTGDFTRTDGLIPHRAVKPVFRLIDCIARSNSYAVAYESMG